MKLYDPIIYRRFALQELKLKNLADLDIFDDLADIDYLTNLKNKILRVGRSLTEQRLLPSNFTERINSDVQRVCYIRDAFKIESSQLGGVLERIDKYRREITDSCYSFSQNDILEAQDYLRKLEHLFVEFYPKIKELHYSPDWSPDGNLESNLNEFYYLTYNRSFLNNTSLALITFIKSPSTFEAKVKSIIIEFRDILDKWNKNYQEAKLLEPKIKQLYEKGSIESLRGIILKINRFKDIASNEKKQLLLYDKMHQEKIKLHEKFTSFAEDSKIYYKAQCEKKLLSSDSKKNLELLSFPPKKFDGIKGMRSKYIELRSSFLKLLENCSTLNLSLKRNLGLQELVDDYNNTILHIQKNLTNKAFRVNAFATLFILILFGLTGFSIYVHFVN